MRGSRDEMNRRSFLRLAGATLASTAGLMACAPEKFEAFVQDHFRELTGEERAALLSRKEKAYRRAFGREVEVEADPPLEGVLFAGALDFSRCIGCRRCVYACVKENNQSRHPQIHWIHVLQMEKEKGVDVLEADLYYEAEEVPQEGHFYFPVSCQHCRAPQCTTVCPVQATWIEPDGLVVVDYDWCIGCRYCIAACPYQARSFNWGDPTLPPEALNGKTHYLGNRPRPASVVEKCTFCIQRVRKGRYPACVEICPTGARKFGDLNDPDSEIRYIVENKRVLVFKEALGTQPKFFYFT